MTNRVAAWIVTLGTSCSSGTVQLGPVGAKEFCSTWAEIICMGDRLCCPTGSPSPICLAVQRGACDQRYGPLLQDPRTAYNPVHGGQFLVRLRDRTARCSTEPWYLEDILEMFDGTGEVNADCTPSSATEPELLLVTLTCRRENTCHLTLRANGDVRGTCEPLAGGTDCSQLYDCPPGLWCNLPAQWQPGYGGECQPYRTSGWTCGSALECASQYCDPMKGCATPSVTEAFCRRPLDVDGGPQSPVDAAIP